MRLIMGDGPCFSCGGGRTHIQLLRRPCVSSTSILHKMTKKGRGRTADKNPPARSASEVIRILAGAAGWLEKVAVWAGSVAAAGFTDVADDAFARVPAVRLANAARFLVTGACDHRPFAVFRWIVGVSSAADETPTIHRKTANGRWSHAPVTRKRAAFARRTAGTRANASSATSVNPAAATDPAHTATFSSQPAAPARIRITSLALRAGGFLSAVLPLPFLVILCRMEVEETQGRLKSWMWVRPPPHEKQGPSPMINLIDEILDLKARNNATILAHYYQDGEIQELADFTGDSLKLAREATKVATSTIVFCGVHFMAETAKILNPEKRVLLPDLQAGCSLADRCPPEDFKAFRAKHPNAFVVTYVNSSAAVKAM